MSLWRGLKNPFLGFFLLYALLFTAFFHEAINSPVLLTCDDGFLDSYPEFLRGPTLWAEHAGSGYPVVSNPDSGIWYPVSWIFQQLSRTGWQDAFDFYVISAYVLAAFFFHLFIFEWVGKHAPALVGALVYSMGSHTMVRMEHDHLMNAIAWFPLALWGIERYRRTLTLKPLGWLSLSIFMIVVSHVQIGVYGALGTLGYAVFRSNQSRDRGRYAVGILGAFALSVFMTAVHILPVVEVFSEYARKGRQFEFTLENQLGFGDLWNLLLPESYAVLWGVSPTSTLFQGNFQESRVFFGALPLFLALLGIWKGSRFDRGPRVFFGVIALLFVAASLGAHTPVARFLYHVPGLSGFRCLSRYHFLAAVGVAALAAMGTDRFLGSARPSRVFVATCLSLAIAIPLGFCLHVSFEGSWSVMRRPFVPTAFLSFLGAGVLVACFAGRLSPRLRSGVIAGSLIGLLLIADLARFGVWFKGANENFTGPETLEAVRRTGGWARRLVHGENRASDLDNGYLRSELSSLMGVHSVSQHRSWRSGILDEQAHLLLSGDVEANKRVSGIASLLAVQVIVLSTDNPDQARLAKNFSGWPHINDGFGLSYFQNPMLPSRAWFAPSQVFDFYQTQMKAAGDNEGNLRKVLDDYEKYLASRPIVPGRSVQLVSHRGQVWRMKASAGPEGWLVFSQRYHPGWKVRINGVRVEPVKAYGQLMAVPLAASLVSQDVHWWFLPATVVLGGSISVLAWLACLVVLLRYSKVVVPEVAWRKAFTTSSAPTPA